MRLHELGQESHEEQHHLGVEEIDADARPKALPHGGRALGRLAKEVGRYGVLVNCLVPGLLETGLSSRLPKHRVESYVSQAALGRLGTVEEVADLAAWLVSDENTFMTGGQVVIDGGL